MQNTASSRAAAERAYARSQAARAALSAPRATSIPARSRRCSISATSDAIFPGKFKFGVTGCQNNCLKAEENDLGIKGGRKVQRKPDACIHCGICSKVCKPGAITDDGKKIVVDYGKCVSRGKCSQKCPVASWNYQTVYSLTFGGLFGNHITKGRKLLPPVESDEQLLAVADATIQWYDDHAIPGDRFKFCLDREGWDSFVPVVRKAYDEVAPEGCPKADSVEVEPPAPVA